LANGGATWGFLPQQWVQHKGSGPIEAARALANETAHPFVSLIDGLFAILHTSLTKT
jgi:hypothetical protein